MKKWTRRLGVTLFDAGGPLVIVLLIGVPILLILAIIGLVVLAIHLIDKARRKDDADAPPPQT